MLTRIAAATLALGLSLSASSAVAETTPIFKAPIGSQEASKTKRFGINPELGRAWVEIEIWQNTSETSELHRVLVPGLSYSKEASQIVFNSDRQSVVCANVRESGFWIFKHERIEPTGDCELTRKYVKVPIDDGFSVDVIEHFEVHFKPVSPTAIAPARTGKSR